MEYTNEEESPQKVFSEFVERMEERHHWQVCGDSYVNVLWAISQSQFILLNVDLDQIYLLQLPVGFEETRAKNVIFFNSIEYGKESQERYYCSYVLIFSERQILFKELTDNNQECLILNISILSPSDQLHSILHISLRDELPQFMFLSTEGRTYVGRACGNHTGKLDVQCTSLDVPHGMLATMKNVFSGKKSEVEKNEIGHLIKELYIHGEEGASLVYHLFSFSNYNVQAWTQTTTQNITSQKYLWSINFGRSIIEEEERATENLKQIQTYQLLEAEFCFNNLYLLAYLIKSMKEEEEDYNIQQIILYEFTSNIEKGIIQISGRLVCLETDLIMRPTLYKIIPVEEKLMIIIMKISNNNMIIYAQLDKNQNIIIDCGEHMHGYGWIKYDTESLNSFIAVASGLKYLTINLSGEEAILDNLQNARGVFGSFIYKANSSMQLSFKSFATTSSKIAPPEHPREISQEPEIHVNIRNIEEKEEEIESLKKELICLIEELNSRSVEKDINREIKMNIESERINNIGKRIEKLGIEIGGEHIGRIIGDIGEQIMNEHSWEEELFVENDNNYMKSIKQKSKFIQTIIHNKKNLLDVFHNILLSVNYLTKPIFKNTMEIMANAREKIECALLLRSIENNSLNHMEEKEYMKGQTHKVLSDVFLRVIAAWGYDSRTFDNDGVTSREKVYENIYNFEDFMLELSAAFDINTATLDLRYSSRFIEIINMVWINIYEKYLNCRIESERECGIPRNNHWMSIYQFNSKPSLIQTLFFRNFKTTAQIIIKLQSFNRASLIEQLIKIGEIILSEMEFGTSLNTPSQEIADLCKNCRTEIIAELKHLSPKQALQFAINYRDFEQTIEICVILNNYETLYLQMENWKSEGFVKMVFNWYLEYEKNNYKKIENESLRLDMLCLFGNKFQEELSEFLINYPRLKAIFFLKFERYAEAEELLIKHWISHNLHIKLHIQKGYILKAKLNNKFEGEKKKEKIIEGELLFNTAALHVYPPDTYADQIQLNELIYKLMQLTCSEYKEIFTIAIKLLKIAHEGILKFVEEESTRKYNMEDLVLDIYKSAIEKEYEQLGMLRASKGQMSDDQFQSKALNTLFGELCRIAKATHFGQLGTHELNRLHLPHENIRNLLFTIMDVVQQSETI